MATPFDHVQLLKTAAQLLGGTGSSTVELTSAETEIFRFYANPGFNGTLSFIEGQILIYSGTLTWTVMAQIRCRGESVWTDIWAAYKAGPSAAAFVYPFGKDGGAGFNTSPLEVRIVGKHATTGSASMSPGNASTPTAWSSIRLVGESV